MSETIDLTGARALVTGAGRGIGRSIALRLARAGVDVAVNDIDAESAARTAAEVARCGRRGEAVPGDLARSETVAAVCDEAVRRLGGIDILVNNAGISRYRPILESSEADWDAHLNIMAKATFLTMKHLAPGMMERRWGRIVNLGSYVAQFNAATKYFGPYCAAKAAIVALTQVAAQEFAPHVTVNAVGPGDVETDMMEQEWVQEASRRAMAPGDVKEEYRRRLILGRFEQPDDIAGVVLFLCSPLADQITGSHLIVSGGLPFKNG
jgi:NAD(P)-dependent dehydrogenase (short-subunit alcohol dehydrogenase family)